MDVSVYPNKDVIAASKLCVNIFCNGETDHAADKKYGREEWCENNYGQKCAEHVKNHQSTSNLFFKGTIMNPTTILCNPDGTEIKRKVGAMPAKDLITMIKEAGAKVGPGITQDEYLFAKGKLKVADDALATKDTKEAIEALNSIVKAFAKNPADKVLVDMAQKKLDDINAAGMALVETAKADAAAGKVEDARKGLKEVFSNYKGLECAKVAEKEYAALPKDK